MKFFSRSLLKLSLPAGELLVWSIPLYAKITSSRNSKSRMLMNKTESSDSAQIFSFQNVFLFFHKIIEKILLSDGNHYLCFFLNKFCFEELFFFSSVGERNFLILKSYVIARAPQIAGSAIELKRCSLCSECKRGVLYSAKSTFVISYAK